MTRREIPATINLSTFNDVTIENLVSLQTKIKNTISRASFIALDAEFTGLGGRHADTKAFNLEDRYENLCKVAKSYAILSLGFTTFELLSTEEGEIRSNELEKSYAVHNFSFTLSCQSEHKVSPNSLKFLAGVGFDFHKQLMHGIPYEPGPDKAVHYPNHPNVIMRSIFSHILAQKIPLVVHNGFLDLIFIYYAFYADLPPDLNSFVADLTEMFPAGIIDTKYISSYVTDEKTTFLAYLYRKYEREQFERKMNGKKEYLDMKFQEKLSCIPVKRSRDEEDDYESSSHGHNGRMHKTRYGNEKNRRKYEDDTDDDDKLPYCQQYASYGYCRMNMQCGKSHDLDLILDYEAEQEGRRKHHNFDSTSKALKETRVSHSIKTKKDSDSSAEVSPSSPSMESASTFETEHSSSRFPVNNVKISAKAKTINDINHYRENSLSVTPRTKENIETYHAAHFDSYMTGFVFARQLLVLSEVEVLNEHKNKLYLMNKDRPLLVQKSEFAHTSEGHRTKAEAISRSK